MKGATFNRTNENVDWAWWTWNPVTGCKHGCPYCYARDIAKRYTGHFNPEFHEDRLSAPKNTKFPKGGDKGLPWSRMVFVCSMADLFGEWVPQEWIDAVLDAVRAAPEWTFLFLTKNPERMAGIDWPDNAWAGTTVDEQSRVARAEEAFNDVTAKVKFISLEPFSERITFNHLDRFDWLILGGRSRSSGMPAMQPQKDWVGHALIQAHEAGIKVYRKPNLPLQECP